MIVDAEVGVLQVVLAHRYLAVRCFKVIRLCKKATVSSGSFHLLEVCLDHRYKVSIMCKSNFEFTVQLSLTPDTE